MKKLLLFILISTVCIVSACKKSSTTTTGLIMSAVVDNKAWKSSNSQVTLDKTNGLHLVINADSASTRMTLSIANYYGEGTYVIADSGNTASYTDHGNTLHKATSGQIVIKKASTNGTTLNNFKGTFEFLADTVQVTTGAFDVNLYLN